MFKELTIIELENHLNNIVFNDNNYVKTYPYFVSYFKNIKEIKVEHLIISSHFVYGWMPTIIDLNLKNVDEFLLCLNAAKNGKALNLKELELGKTIINNSAVGLSKLLHFINPNLYAIWDSRIFRFLTKKKSSYGISEPKNYIAYLNYLSKLTTDLSFKRFHRKVNAIVGYDVTSLRALELIMFETDKQTK